MTYFEKYIHQMSFPAIVVEETGKIESINPVASKLFNCIKESDKPLYLYDVFGYLLPHTHENQLKKIIEKKNTSIYYERIKIKDQSYFFEIHIQQIEYHKDNKNFLMLLYIDKTATKNLEETNIKNEFLLKRAQQIAKIGSFIYYPSFGEVFISDELSEMLGFSIKKDSISIEDIVAKLVPEDQVIFVQAINLNNSSIIESSHKTFEFSYHNYKNQIKEALCIIETEKNKSSEVNRIIGIIQDITKQKNNERKIKENLKFQQIINNIATTFNSFENFHSKVSNTIVHIAEFTGATKVFFFDHSSKIGNSSKCILWKEGKITNNSKQSSFEYESLWPSLQEYFEMDSIISTFNIGTLNSEVQEFFKNQNVKSLLIIPLKIKNELNGMIGIEEHKTNRVWTNLEIEFIKTISLVLSNAIEKRLSENELKENEEKFRTIFNSTGEAIFICGLDGRFIEVNETACQMLEYSKNELLKMTPTDIAFADYINKAEMEMGQVRQSDQLLFGANIQSKSGRVIPIEANTQIIKLEGTPVFLNIVNDVTDRVEKKRKILSAIIETEDKERKRFAEDLHDGLGPLLSSIKIYVNLFKTEDYPHEERIKLAGQASELIDEAISNAKRIAYNLMPNTLMDFGLVTSLNSFIMKLNSTKVINIHFNCNIKERIDHNIEAILYRVMKELINNTIKHAKAQNIKIELMKSENIIFAKYRDDGVGFNVKEKMQSKTGNGLKNITNKIKSIGGKVIFKSKVNKGTLVKIHVIIY